MVCCKMYRDVFSTTKSYKEAMELVKEFHATRPDCYFVYDSEKTTATTIKLRAASSKEWA